MNGLNSTYSPSVRKLQNTWRLVWGCFFLSLLVVYGCNKSTKKEVVSDATSYDFNTIKSKIQDWVDQGYYSGASIIVAKNNEVIYEDYFGDYNRETQVYIASAGKWLAAATVAAVVEEGKISWDDKVKKWLPEFKDIKGEATLRQLFSHTSGYPDYQPEGAHPDDYQTLKEAVKHIVNLPADTIPGSEFHYGGLAMQVGGRMAELAAGKNFESLFQEKIARPLGMTKTNFTPVDAASGHNPMVGGGARSTLHDYLKFLQMIANEGVFKKKKILSISSLSEMEADQVGRASVKPGEFVEAVRDSKHTGIYGLGLWREELDENGNALLISSPSWAGAYPWVDKKNNVYGFFLTHVNVEQASGNNFSSFYASPVLATMVREILQSQKRIKLEMRVRLNKISISKSH